MDSGPRQQVISLFAAVDARKIHTSKSTDTRFVTRESRVIETWIFVIKLGWFKPCNILMSRGIFLLRMYLPSSAAASFSPAKAPSSDANVVLLESPAIERSMAFPVCMNSVKNAYNMMSLHKSNLRSVIWEHALEQQYRSHPLVRSGIQ